MDEKQDFERFLIFLNIEKKSKKLEFKIEFKLNEEFVAMLREKQRCQVPFVFPLSVITSGC